MSPDWTYGPPSRTRSKSPRIHRSGDGPATAAPLGEWDRRIDIEPDVRHLYLPVAREIRDVDKVIWGLVAFENGRMDEHANLPAALLPTTQSVEQPKYERFERPHASSLGARTTASSRAIGELAGHALRKGRGATSSTMLLPGFMRVEGSPAHPRGCVCSAVAARPDDVRDARECLRVEGGVPPR